MSNVVGIDLGTTNSLIGTVVEGRARLFPDEEGRVLLPSVVALAEGERLLVGRRALNRRLLDPEGTIQQVKRSMGRSTVIPLGGRSLSPQAVSALILGALLDRAEAALGERPARAIITVPAYFDDVQRQATKEAGELAGLTIERLVNEPTAAALTHTTGAEATVLVYDFGGGTFDVSILERDEGFLEVKASHGDTRLGGADIDAALVEHVLSVLQPAEAAQVRQSPGALARLEAVVERAKIALSRQTQVDLHEPFLAGEGSGAVHLEMTLSRATLESIAAPFVERTLASIDEALAAADITADEVDRILLVGGSAQMPLVRERVEAHLDRPAMLAEEPDLAVAQGAALLAGRAAGQGVEEILVDVTPHTLSVGSLDVDMSDERLRAVPIIPRNTIVPVERAETFYTRVDGQTAVSGPIVQGEGTFVEDNTWLGEVYVSALPPSPAGSPVEVRYRLDISGLLHVSATHVPSGKVGEVIIRNGPSRLTRSERRRTEGELARLRDSGPDASSDPSSNGHPNAHLNGHPGGGDLEADDAGASELRLADALLARAKRVLTRELSPDGRREVEEARNALQSAVDSGAALEILSERVDRLSGALLDLV